MLFKQKMEKKPQTLEEILSKNAHITLRERAGNIWYNIKENAPSIACVLGTAALLGIGIYSAFEWAQVAEATRNYQQAYDVINQFYETLTTLQKVNLNDKQLSNAIPIPELVDFPRRLLEEGSKVSYPEKAREIIDWISQHTNTAKFDPLNYTAQLKDKLLLVASTPKEVFACLGATLGSLAGVLLGAVGLETIMEFELYDSLRQKKINKAVAKKVIKNLINNPNREELSKILLEHCKERNEAEWQNISQFSSSHNNIEDKLVLNAAIKRRLFDLPIIQRAVSIYKSAPEDSQKENYLALFTAGWEPNNIYNFLVKVYGLGEESKNFFTGLLSTTKSENMLGNALKIYEYTAFGNYFSAEKVSEIIGQLCKTGKRGLMSELAEIAPNIRNLSPEIRAYLERTDEIPNIGRAGQIELIKLFMMSCKLRGEFGASPSDFYSSIISDSVCPTESERIMKEYTAIADLSQKVGDKSKDIENLLIQYCSFVEHTKGREDVQKGLKSIQKVLETEKEKKAIKKIRDRVERARYDAFNEKIRESLVQLIKTTFEEESECDFDINPSIIDRSEKIKELMNVIKGYDSLSGEARSLLGGLLKVALSNPSEVRGYLNNLEGNRSLEAKLGKEKIAKWLEGYEKEYKTDDKEVKFYDSKDVIESLNMGDVVGSCLAMIGGVNRFSAVTNTVDYNKKAVYMKVDGKKVGRTLAVLTDKGIMTFRRYNSANLNVDEEWVDYFVEYARKVGVPLIVPETYVDSGLRDLLKKKGAKMNNVEAHLHKAVAEGWYSDAINSSPAQDGGSILRCRAYII